MNSNMLFCFVINFLISSLGEVFRKMKQTHEIWYIMKHGTLERPPSISTISLKNTEGVEIKIN